MRRENRSNNQGANIFLQCALVILCLLEIAMFTTISCDESDDAMRHSALEKGNTALSLSIINAENLVKI